MDEENKDIEILQIREHKNNTGAKPQKYVTIPKDSPLYNYRYIKALGVEL